MTRTHQLEATLKALRLSGMLETFEARLTQARAGDLGHTEFLQALCEDELSRRQAAGITRRVRAAHFEQVCAIEDYDFNYNPKIPAAHIRDLATLRFVESGESVILHGPVGVGKTMIARRSVTRRVDGATDVRSPRPSACWPTFREDTPTGRGRPGCTPGPGRRC
jgi:DNA replication protein DnaC